MVVQKRITWIQAGWLSLLIACGLIACRGTGTGVPTAAPTLIPAATDPPATATPVPTEDTGMIAARVRGEPIPLADYERQVRQFRAVYTDKDYDWGSEEGQRRAVQIQREVLRSLIQTLLIQQEAARRGLAISDEELEANVRESIEKGGGEASFQKWLRQNDLTREEFAAEVRMGLLTARLIEEVTRDLERSAEQVHVRQILLADPTTATQVRRVLEAGEDFATLAAQYSHDQASRDDGGDLGWFARGLLIPPEVEEAAFALQPGDISEVVQSPMGYHIIQIVERESDRPLPLDVFQALKGQIMARWLEEQTRSAQIEILIDTSTPLQE